MSTKGLKVKRGASLYEASNDNLKKLMDRTKDRHSHAEIAAEIGISPSHLYRLLRGNDKVSRLIDRAAEGLLRRFVKDAQAGGPRLMVCRVAIAHWPTIALWVKNLGGSVVDEFHALLTDDKNAAPEFVVAIITVDHQHVEGVSMLITTTEGEVRKVMG